MSRLNASIKLVVMIGESFFILIAIFTSVLSGLISSGKILSLNFDAAKQMAKWTLCLSLLIFMCNLLFGCCGTVNQIVRRGICSGRRLLSFYQILLIAVLVLSIGQVERLIAREKSLDLVLSNVTRYLDYDDFEKRLDTYFNGVYFEEICMDDPLLEGFVMKWVDLNCPMKMSPSICDMTPLKKETCDTSCENEVWDVNLCCPSEEECITNNNMEACPYSQCRVPILEEVKSIIQPVISFLQIVSMLCGIMILFTCLLICYNPRDEIEVELLKTGVMTEEDIETIQKLKAQKRFSYEKGKGPNNHRQSINLNSIYNDRARVSSMSSMSSRTQFSQISHVRESEISRRLVRPSSSRVHPSISASP